MAKIQQIQSAIRSVARPLAIATIIGLSAVGAGMYATYERVQRTDKPILMNESAWTEQVERHYYSSMIYTGAAALGGIGGFIIAALLIPSPAPTPTEAEQRELDKAAAARFLTRALEQGTVRPEQWADLQPVLGGENDG